MLLGSVLLLGLLSSSSTPKISTAHEQAARAGTQSGKQSYALMPVKIIPNARPLSWNRSSQSLALAGIVGFPNRKGARQTLQAGGRLPAALDRRLLRYHLDTDTTDEVFNANPGFSLRQVKWLGQTSDLAFGLENVEGRQVGVVVSRRGQEPRVVNIGEGASLITIATSSQLPVLVVCQSGSAKSFVTAYSLDQTTEVKKVPEGLIAATLRESDNPNFAILVGINPASGQGNETFGIDLRTASLVPESAIPSEPQFTQKPVFDFVLKAAPVPGVPGERNDVFAERDGAPSVFLCRNARSLVTSPDGLKTAVWDGSSVFIYEFVALKN